MRCCCELRGADAVAAGAVKALRSDAAGCKEGCGVALGKAGGGTGVASASERAAASLASLALAIAF